MARYDRKYLQERLNLFKFGTNKATGLHDIASSLNDTITSGLTEQQIDDISDWADGLIEDINTYIDNRVATAIRRHR